MLNVFLIGAAIGCIGYLGAALFQIVRSLGAARPTEAEGVAAVTIAWGRVASHTLLSGLAVGVVAILIAKLREGLR